MAELGFLPVAPSIRTADEQGSIEIDEVESADTTEDAATPEESTVGLPGWGKVINGLPYEDERLLYNQLGEYYGYTSRVFRSLCDVVTIAVTPSLLYLAVSAQDNVRTAILSGVASLIFLVYGLTRK